ncbi:MAG: TetR/AcrR family transcriptional regulator [Pseudomonadota bacterium]
MTTEELSAKERLVAVSAALLRRHGYHGVGLNDILAAAKVPKGSLYHHFPGGKSDLAMAAADAAGKEMVRIIDDSFQTAGSVEDGITTICHKIAKLFDIFDRADGCPVTSVLFDAPENTEFREKAKQIFDTWIGTTRDYVVEMGMDPDRATDLAEHLLVLLEGAWIMARARQSSDMIRSIPARLFR